MRTLICSLFLLFTQQIKAYEMPGSPRFNVESVLKAQVKQPRWDELLTRMDTPGKMKVLGYASAMGAAVGALSGIKTRTLDLSSEKIPQNNVELPLTPDLDSVTNAATGAALGGLLGMSHIAFADSGFSNQLRDDPKNPHHFRKNIFRLTPRLRSKCAYLALNTVF